MKEVFASLGRHEFSVGQLHGDMEQRERMETLRQFKENEIQLLVASDVAARGLDVPDVSHVFNFDVPGHPDDYVHRIGRTGRAGREGTAYTIATKSKIDVRLLEAIEKLTKAKLPMDENFALEKESRPIRPSDRRRDDRKDSYRDSRRPNANTAKAADDMPHEPFVGMGPHTPAFLLRNTEKKLTNFSTPILARHILRSTFIKNRGRA